MRNPFSAAIEKFKNRRQVIIASPLEEANRPRVYPDFVKTPEERKRWDAARLAAIKLAGEIEGDEYTVHLATRSLYNSDIPTE